MARTKETADSWTHHAKSRSPKEPASCEFWTGLAAVALAGTRSLAGFRTAGLTAVGALARFAFDAAVLVGAADSAGAAVSEDLARGKQRRRNDGEDDFHIGITLGYFAPKSRAGTSSASAPFAPGSDESLGLGIARLHDEVPASAGLADIVGLEREPDAFGAAPAAFQTQMTPPGAVVVPDVVIGSVFAVWQFYDLVHTAYCLGIFQIPKENSS